MRHGLAWIAGVWTLSLCACSGDTASGSGGSSESGSSTDSTSGPETVSGTADTTESTTNVDTTCGDACPGTSESSTTASDTSTTTSVGESSSESSTTPADSSSSDEGPLGVCGNGIVEGGEDCDESGETATCDDDCSFVDCGDENVNETAGEICDAGGEALGCDADCTLPECGDGITNESDNEMCDDAGASASCDADCTPAECGDGTQNVVALEACDDGDNNSGDGCSATCVVEGDFGGTCRIVDGMQWCFDDDACGQGCDDVCTALGLTIEPDDAVWFAAQDSSQECQAIADAFEMVAPIDFGDHALGCLEDEGLDDLVGGGLAGSLLCSSDPACPAAHRAGMDNAGTNCNLAGARRSVCPCVGQFCGNGVVEGTEECDDGNDDNVDGCHSTCIFTPPSCVTVAGQQWCYDPVVCGEACEDVCEGLGLSLDIGDAEWFALQDTLAECNELAAAFAMTDAMLSNYQFGCLEEQAADDVPLAGITGRLYCSTNAMCPTLHRTGMDSLGVACDQNLSFRSICPCN